MSFNQFSTYVTLIEVFPMFVGGGKKSHLQLTYQNIQPI